MNQLKYKNASGCYNTIVLPLINRFNSRKEISLVFKNGQRRFSQIATLNYWHNPERKNQAWRLAVIVGKTSVSKLATHRNKAKRQLLNAFYQTSQYYNLDGLDFVIVAKKRVLEISFEQLQNELNQLLKQC